MQPVKEARVAGEKRAESEPPKRVTERPQRRPRVEPDDEDVVIVRRPPVYYAPGPSIGIGIGGGLGGYGRGSGGGASGGYGGGTAGTGRGRY